MSISVVATSTSYMYSKLKEIPEFKFVVFVFTESAKLLKI